MISYKNIKNRIPQTEYFRLNKNQIKQLNIAIINGAYLLYYLEQYLEHKINFKYFFFKPFSITVITSISFIIINIIHKIIRFNYSIQNFKNPIRITTLFTFKFI